MRAWLLPAAMSLMTLAAECNYPTGPLNPDEDITRIQPTQEMRIAWDESVQCVRFPWPKLFHQIEFYRVSDKVKFACRGLVNGCYDLFSGQKNKVYFGGGKIEQADIIVFRHAFGHYMIRDDDHKSSLWDRCGMMKDSWVRDYELRIPERIN